MLGAERELLAAKRVQQASRLLEKELHYMMIELRSIGTMAALFSGFVIKELNRQGSTVKGNPMLGGGGATYGGKYSRGLWNEAGHKVVQLKGAPFGMSPQLAFSEILFTLVLSLSLVANLMCVFSVSCLVSLGARRALTASECEMERVLIRLRLERRKTVRRFLVGSMAFLTSSVVVAWSYWQGPSAIVMTAVVGYAFWKVASMERSARAAFRAPPLMRSRWWPGPRYDPRSEPLLQDLLSNDALRADLGVGAATTAATAATTAEEVRRRNVIQ